MLAIPFAPPAAMTIAADATPAPSVVGTISVNGYIRMYRLYRPTAEAAGKAVPLVVVFHGYGGSPELVESKYEWDAAADAGGFEVAYPEGTARSWNAGACCGDAVKDTINDVAFFDSLVAKLEGAPESAADPKRIYAAGMSNGAMMTYALACKATTPIAAIGSVAGVMTEPCPKPAQRPSVMEIHGLADTIVPFAGPGGPGSADVPASMARWRAIDGCAKPATSKTGPVATAISACDGGRAVVLVTVDGAGHQWPGANPPTAQQRAYLERLGIVMPEPSHALDATTTLWTFFAAHSAP